MVRTWPPSPTRRPPRPRTVTRPRVRARRREPVAARADPRLARARAGHGPGASPATAAARAAWTPCSAASNPDQLRAVTHGDGPLLVIAGAGTGKTQVITRRIAWLIATRRARPSEILALTFTDKAADEMAVRVDQLVPYGYTDTAIATFHAFGDRLIREYALELGLPPDVRVLSRAEVVIFLREHLFEFDLDATGRSATRPASWPRWRRCSAAARTRTSARPTYVDARRAAGGGGGGRRRGGRGRSGRTATRPRRRPRTRPPGRAGRAPTRRYQRPAGRERLHRLRRPGRPRPAPGARRRRPPGRRSPARFRYVLVDEFQDTNRAQAELVDAARRAAPQRDRRRRRRPGHLRVPRRGDRQHPRVRGALPGRPDRRPAPQLPVAGADPRRRLPAHPVQRPGSPRGPDRGRQAAAAERRDPRAAPVRLEAFATGLRRGRLDRRGHRAGASPPGRRPRDHAVLVRANGHADPILRALNVAGIPWRFSGSSGLYARPEVRLLMAFLRAIADPESSVDVYALAASEVYGLGGEDLTAIVNSARRRNRSVWAVLDELERQPGHPARLAGDRARPSDRLVGDLDALRRRWPTSGRPARCCTRSCATAGCSPGWPRRDTAAAEEALANVARFFDIVRAQSALLADDRAVVRGAATCRRSSRPATTRRRPTSTRTPTRVAVLTVHKAKGLEFPVVYLPGLVAGRFPGNGRGEPLAAAGRAGPRRAADARARARRGAPAVLRRDDPGPRRARSCPTPPTTAAPAPDASRRSSSRRSTCRPPPARPGAGASRRRRRRSASPPFAAVDVPAGAGPAARSTSRCR